MTNIFLVLWLRVIIPVALKQLLWLSVIILVALKQLAEWLDELDERRASKHQMPELYIHIHGKPPPRQ